MLVSCVLRWKFGHNTFRNEKYESYVWHQQFWNKISEPHIANHSLRHNVWHNIVQQTAPKRCHETQAEVLKHKLRNRSSNPQNLNRSKPKSKESIFRVTLGLLAEYTFFLPVIVLKSGPSQIQGVELTWNKWQNTFEAVKRKILWSCSESKCKSCKAYLENAAVPFQKFLPSARTRMNHDKWNA